MYAILLHAAMYYMYVEIENTNTIQSLNHSLFYN